MAALKMIPSSLISHILSFAHGRMKDSENGDSGQNDINEAETEEEAEAKAASAISAISATSTSTIAKYNDCRPKNEKVSEDIEVDLTDMSLYKPGHQIVIPLTNPSCHLTGMDSNVFFFNFCIQDFLILH